MKKLLVYSLIVAAIVFTSCTYTEPEPPISKECNIESFYAGGKNWEINGLNITAIFSKGTPVSSLSPIIQISDKATIRPLSGVAQDFSNDRPVTYTVTAEDGKTQKTYTAKATVQ
jgi:hypothetical protein